MKTALFSFLALFASLVSTSTAAQIVQPVPTAARPPGLYVAVIDGLIHVTNPAGSQNFSAGQFGFTPSYKQPPVMLPTNPGMPFTPPPVFISNQPTAPASSSASGKSDSVECIVR